MRFLYLALKKLIRNVNFQDAKALADAALQKPTAAEIDQLIEEFFAGKFIKLNKSI